MQSPHTIEAQIVELRSKARRMAVAPSIDLSAGVRLVNSLLACAMRAELADRPADASELRTLAAQLQVRLRSGASSLLPPPHAADSAGRGTADGGCRLFRSTTDIRISRFTGLRRLLRLAGEKDVRTAATEATR